MTGRTRDPAFGWYVAYGLVGAVAIGFEQVFFRLIDGVMRSNAYTFAFVLAIYLGLWSVGSLVGSALVRRAVTPRRWFWGLQLGVVVGATGSLAVAVHLLPALGLRDRYDSWFNSDGLASGLNEAAAFDRLVFGLGAPLLLMGVPVLLFGATFPFAQALVSRSLGTIGRTTGRLVFASIIGNVTGALVASFVLLDRLGTAGTYVVLTAVLAVPALGALWWDARVRPRRLVRLTTAAAVTLVVALVVMAVPSNDELWATLHGTTPAAILVAEDRSCVSAVELYGEGGSQLTINAAAQNGHPFDDFHVLIGLLPALAHDDPDHALAIGLGIGSTSYAMLASGRPDAVTTVELCGGNYELVRALAERGATDLALIDSDPRHRSLVGDGRTHLLTDDSKYDLIVPDTSRTTSAGSGNLFSREFFELMSSRLSSDGLVAIWQATNRVVNAATSTFPHVVSVEVPSYNGSRFMLASHSPIRLDPESLTRRFDAMVPGSLPEAQRIAIREFLGGLVAECLNDGTLPPEPRPDAENRDLHPRDEYFLTNDGTGEDGVVRTCSGPVPTPAR